MNKKAIITSLIITMVGIIALGIGWHKIFDASATKPNLIECKAHIDENLDLSCDKCGANLSFEDIAKEQKIVAQTQSGASVEVEGNMPQNTKVIAKDIAREEAITLAKKYVPQLEDDKILYAYDIALQKGNVKYEPYKYDSNVNVNISNIGLNGQKDVALLHIIDDKDYEIIKLDSNNTNNLRFKATSFSTYIVISVATHTVEFMSDGNFVIYNLAGRMLSEGETVVDGTNFSFTIKAIDCGIAEVDASEGTLTRTGGELYATCSIDQVTADTVVKIAQIDRATITTQPKSAKVKIGETATYTVECNNIIGYEWQYRKSASDYWKPATQIGTATQTTLTIDNVQDEQNGYEIRYLAEADQMDGDHRTISETALLIVSDGTTMTEVDVEIAEETKMVTVWEIPADNTEIKLPVRGTVNLNVDWGDGSAIEVVTTSFPTHIYTTAGTYEIKIWGDCSIWGYAALDSVEIENDYYTYTQYLTKVRQLGELNAIKYGFAHCENLVEFSGENLVASKTFEKTTYMGWMFKNCSNLTTLDTSKFDTSKVTSMIGMFEGCVLLTDLNVSNFNTSNVTDMRQVFNQCENLISLNVSEFDTSNVIYMSSMFKGCSSLLSIDLSNFNTSNVTEMNGMFSGCSSLTSLDVSNFDTSNVINMGNMFDGCSKLASIDISNFDTSKVTDMRCMFSSCSYLTSLDVSGFDTSKVTNMLYIFRECRSLTSLDISNFDTSNVTNMSSMFSSCSGLTSLDVSNFDTSSVTDMSFMFSDCNGLTSLDVSNFDTSSITNMNLMFDDCNSLTSLDISNFDTSNVTNIAKMFYGCSNLKSLQLSNNFKIPTSNVENMFTDTTNLKSIILIDSTPLASQFASVKDQLAGKTFYVPDKSAELDYEIEWESDFTSDRIQPILELDGDLIVTINKGEAYSDQGYKVAGLSEDEAEYYAIYGYNVTQTGEVFNNMLGTYKIKYEINRTYTSGGATKTDTLMSVERTIIVKDATPTPIPTPTPTPILVNGVDITPPRGSVTVIGSTIENGVNNVTSKEFTIRIQATDDVSTSSEIKVYVVLNKIPDTEKILDSAWETYRDGYTKTLTIPDDTTEATVYVVLKDKAGNTQTIFTGSNASYNLKYDANGGTSNIPDQTVYYGMPFKVTKELPTYEGKYFLGWSTTKTATVASYLQNEVISASVFAGTQTDITLYAVWADTIDKLQTLASRVSIGDYVNYPVSYENVLGQDLTGWRVLSIDQTSGTIKLISAGTPLTYYHPSNSDTSAASIKALTEDFLQTGFSTSASTKTNYKFIKSGFDTREVLEKVFLNKYTSTTDTARTIKAEDIYDITGLSEMASGTTMDLSNAKYNNLFANGSTYWIATANGSSLWNVQTDGSVSSNVASELGIRPVVTLRDDIKTFGFDNAGRWYIEAEDLQEVPIVLNANGGTVDKLGMNLIVGEAYGTLPTPTRDGCTFDGWYTAALGGTKITDTSKVTNTSGHTLYAHWTGNQYTVTLNANGGSVDTSTVTVRYNSTYGTLPTPTRAGYKFTGWYTVKLPIDDTQKVTETTTVSKASDHTLYAQWTGNEYIVTLNANGGKVFVSKMIVVYNSIYGTMETPRRSGYTFDGWYTELSGGTRVTETTSVKIIGDHTLYAHWTANQYTVTLNANGGSVSTSTLTVTYDSIYGTLPTPTKTGYKFKGWYTASSEGTKVTATTKVSKAKDHTLYAQWEVAQTTGYITLKYNSSVATGVDSDYTEVSSHHGGTITAKEITSYGVRVSVSGTKINISGLSKLSTGSVVIIRVTSSATSEYTEASADYKIKIGTSGYTCSCSACSNTVSTSGARCSSCSSSDCSTCGKCLNCCSGHGSGGGSTTGCTGSFVVTSDTHVSCPECGMYSSNSDVHLITETCNKCGASTTYYGGLCTCSRFKTTDPVRVHNN